MNTPEKQKGAQKALITALLLIGLTSTTLALSNQTSQLYLSPGEEANFSITGQQGQEIDLKINPPLERPQSFRMNYSNGTYTVQVPGGIFDERERYRYRFISDQESFPSSYQALGVSSLNMTLKQKFLNSTNAQSSDGRCDFNSSNDFGCDYAHFQAYMILSSAAQYHLNHTDKNREKFYNFTFGFYDFTCGPDSGFDCERATARTPYAYSGTKQGSIVYSLWEAYRLVGNETVRELALNFTEGTAETCDVWNDDFRCNTSRAQASMALGYWSAYSMTGNNTIKSIAKNLTETNYSGPRTISAYLRGYLYTSNESYLGEAENSTKKWLKECPNCTAREFADLKNALWNGYLYTGDYGYYRNGVNLTSYRTSRYCSWNQTTCQNPNVQGLSSLSYWKAYRLQKDLKNSFFRPDVPEETIVGENLSIDVVMEGKIEDPVLQFRRQNISGTWNECDINFFDGCTLSGRSLNSQKPYEYRFKSQGSIFPPNGTFSFAPSLVKQNFIDEAVSFSRNNPHTGCEPNNGDYSCENYALQASMIEGFSSLLGFNFSEFNDMVLGNLVTEPYVSLDFYNEDLCKTRNGYMSCREGSNAAEGNMEGSTKQGKMIKSLFSAYQETGRTNYYQKALNYTRGSAQDCDVWNRTYSYSFQCNSSLGQASMIEGYLKAYEVTGNGTFRGVALNLTREGLEMNSSAKLGDALWRSSSMFNGSFRNLSISGNASNISQEFENYCVGNCSPAQHSEVLDLFESAYLYSDSDYSSAYRNALLNTTEDGSCGPFKRDTTCDSPLVQGEFMDAYWKASYTMPVELKVDDGFQVSKDTLTVGDSFQATCSVTNELNNTQIENVEMNLSLSEGLSVDSNSSIYDVGDLNYSDSASNSWEVAAVSPGSRNASCVLTSDSAYRDALVRDIEVEAVQTEPESPESSSPPPVFDVPDEPEEERPENLTINYTNLSEMEWNRSFLQRLGVNTTLRNFTEATSCSTASRELRWNSSQLTVEHNCTADSLLIVDRIHDVSAENARKIGNYSILSEGSVENVSSVSINYSSRGNRSMYSSPLVLAADRVKPPVKFQEIALQVRNGSRVFINASLNREASCTVSEGDELVRNFSTSRIRLTQPLDYGNTTYNVSCGSASVERTFTRERPEPQEQMDGGLEIPFVFIPAALLLAISSGVLYYREELWEEATMKLFEYRFSKFRSAVEGGDTAAAIEAFDSMSRDVSQQVIESDMDLMQGLLLYLLLDLVEEGHEDDVEFDVSDDLDELVERYLDGSDGKATRLVEEKYLEVMER